MGFGTGSRWVAAALVAGATLLPGSGARGQGNDSKPEAGKVLAAALTQAKQTERLVFLHSGAHW